MNFGVTRPPRLRHREQTRTHQGFFLDGGSSVSAAALPSQDTNRSSRTRNSSSGPAAEQNIQTAERLNHQLPYVVAKKNHESIGLSSSSSIRSHQQSSHGPSPGPLQKVESELSTWSKPNLIKPLFASDSASILNNEPAVQKRVYRRDDPWQAAQRGDLVALKGFQLRGQVDWTSKDENGNIPLQYACSTGAHENVMVVPFLLWATDLGDDEEPAMIEACRKICSNKQAKAILKAYQKGGRGAIGMGGQEQVEAIQQESHKQKVERPSDETSGRISAISRSRAEETCDKLPISTGSIDCYSAKSLSTLSGQSTGEELSASDEDQYTISEKLVEGKGREEIGLEVDNTSSPSSSNGGILLNSWVESGKSSSVQPSEKFQQPGSSEGLQQAVVESGELPLKRTVPAAGSTKELVVHRTPPSIPRNPKGNRMSLRVFRDQRDARDDVNSNEIEDWDKPNEEQHLNGRQSFLLGAPAPLEGSDKKKLERRRGRWDDWKVALLLGQDRERGTPRNRAKTTT